MPMDVLFAVFGGVVGALVIMSGILLIGERLLAMLGLTSERTDGAALEPPAPPLLMKPDVATARKQAQATEALAARYKKLENCLYRRYFDPPEQGTNGAFDKAAERLDGIFKAVIADSQALPDNGVLDDLTATWTELVPEDPRSVTQPIRWGILLILLFLVIWLVVFFGGLMPGIPAGP